MYIDPKRMNLAGVQYSFDKLKTAIQDTARTAGQFTAVASIAVNIPPLRVSDLPIIRRMKAEQKQGYRYPDWVWNVMEEQRRQFGSGNGRYMRD